MLRKNGIAIAITASTLTLIAANTPAHAADDFINMFKGFLNRQVQQPTTADPVAQKEAQVSSKMIDAINSNRLTTEQTQILKGQFDNIKSMEFKYRGSGGSIDGIEMASLNAEFNRLDSTLNQMLSGASGANVNVGQNGNFGNNGFPGMSGTGGTTDTSDARFKAMAGRITDSLGNGRLTPAEATTLKTDFDRAVAERDGRRSDGAYTPDDARRVDLLLDELQRKVQSNTHDSQVWPGINGQQAIQAQELTQGLSSGRLTQREYGELRNDSDRIVQMESRARANGLQFGETIALANELFNLRSKIDAKLNNNNNVCNIPGSMSFDNKKNDVMNKIDRGLMSRQLTPPEAEDLRGDFRRLEQLEASYRATHNGLTSPEVLVLQRGLDNIYAELNDKLHDNTTAGNGPGWGWGGRGSDINRKQADLRRRIDEGVNSGKLTSSEATRLRSQLEWIDSVELTLRQSGGRLDTIEEQRLTGDLDKIGDRLTRLMANARTSPGLQSIDVKKAELQKRIDEGVASRRLSPMEERMLRDEYTRITWMQRRLTHDGTLDAADSQRIVSELDRLSEMVTREMNDRRVVGDGRNNFGEPHHNFPRRDQQ